MNGCVKWTTIVVESKPRVFWYAHAHTMSPTTAMRKFVKSVPCNVDRNWIYSFEAIDYFRVIRAPAVNSSRRIIGSSGLVFAAFTITLNYTILLASVNQAAGQSQICHGKY